MSDLTNLDGDLVNEVLKARRLAGIRHIRVVLSTDAGFIAIINPSFPAAADPRFLFMENILWETEIPKNFVLSVKTSICRYRNIKLGYLAQYTSVSSSQSQTIVEYIKSMPFIF